MKQIINFGQLDELTKEQNEKFTEWCKIYSNGEKVTRLNIGQMIELIGLYDREYLKIIFEDYTKMLNGKVEEYELCDVLWEVIKDIL